MNEYIKVIKYKTIAAVLQQCDQPKPSNIFERKDSCYDDYANASTAYALRGNQHPSDRSTFV